jgi:hypothetical protein
VSYGSKQPYSLEGQVARIGRELAALRRATDRWVYVLPISPADVPDDYDSTESAPSFAGAWSNIPDRPATAFKLARGQLSLRLACYGEEGSPGSLIFTLPVGYRPVSIHRLPAQVGPDGAGYGAVDLHPNGQVLFVGYGLLA